MVSPSLQSRGGITNYTQAELRKFVGNPQCVNYQKLIKLMLLLLELFHELHAPVHAAGLPKNDAIANVAEDSGQCQVKAGFAALVKAFLESPHSGWVQVGQGSDQIYVDSR